MKMMNSLPFLRKTRKIIHHLLTSRGNLAGPAPKFITSSAIVAEIKAEKFFKIKNNTKQLTRNEERTLHESSIDKLWHFITPYVHLHNELHNRIEIGELNR